MNIKYLSISVLFIFYFISYTGLTGLLTGETIQMNLKNSGEEYERFYIYDAEIKSAQWLVKNRESNGVVYADIYGSLRLQSATLIDKGIMFDLTPSTIDQYGYIYATRTNYISENVRSNYNEKLIIHSFPKAFLNNNRNLVYSNGISVIYK
jgi:uncharacterized membrane protein